ncbi:helix-turn-helix domain-containing protein [Bathymodiolus japonicus methanotrophic gill symbiont]|uniref:helix-turn-helix domain-containing protein n=1 Tax=Bathymodiolus japonicus methanotrophic gill symbiont TaxID=113269 RepID=UPI001C8DA2E5|nr:helix-turn-helix domain-containing protein [Bathymodiolus japonicus methanotrophic gill symbiont]
MSYTHLCPEERYYIEIELEKGTSQNKIAEALAGAPCYLTKFRDSCRRNSFTYAANRRCSSRPASATD